MRLALYFFCRATRTSFYVWEHDDEWSRSFGLKLKYCFCESKGAKKGGGITPYNGLYGEAPPERGVFSDFKYVTKKRFEKMHSPISLFFFQKYHNTFCCSSKILHKHCFQFLLERFLPREIENNAYSKFLRDGDKEDYGIFEKGVFLTCTSPKMHLVWPPKFCLSIVFNSLGTAVILRKIKNKVCAIIYLFFFFRGEGVKTRCIMGDVQMANSILRASFLFYLFSIYSIIYLFIYLLTGY